MDYADLITHFSRLSWQSSPLYNRVPDNNPTGSSLFPRHTHVNTCERCAWLRIHLSCICYIIQRNYITSYNMRTHKNKWKHVLTHVEENMLT